jgi:hypothetical protein
MHISVDGNSKTCRYGTFPIARAFQQAAIHVSYIFARHEDIRCSGGTAPLILYLGPRGRRVIIFNAWPL